MLEKSSKSAKLKGKKRTSEHDFSFFVQKQFEVEKIFTLAMTLSPVSMKFAWILSLLFAICLEKCELSHLDEEVIYRIGP